MSSIFSVIGPIMVGPSSSHTAGAARLGKMARYLCDDEVASVVFELHGSFAKTYQGHGTDRALLAGILGIGLADFKLRSAFEIAKEKGLKFEFVGANLGGNVHPNTVRFNIKTKSGRAVTIEGSSIGGGNVVITNINGIAVQFTGEHPILVTQHNDTPGVVAHITSLLYESGINIANMRVMRLEGTGKATMYIELDGEISDKKITEDFLKIKGINHAILLDKEMI